MILSNQVECRNCGEKPWSAHRHDMVRCGCVRDVDAVWVDGGMDYLKRSAGVMANFIDISIVLPPTVVEEMMGLLTDPKKNDKGHLCSLLRYVRDELDWDPRGVQNDG